MSCSCEIDEDGFLVIGTGCPVHNAPKTLAQRLYPYIPTFSRVVVVMCLFTSLVNLIWFLVWNPTFDRMTLAVLFAVVAVYEHTTQRYRVLVSGYQQYQRKQSGE